MASYMNTSDQYGHLRQELVSHYFGSLTYNELTAMLAHLRQTESFSERVVRHLREFDAVFTALESRLLVSPSNLALLEKLAEVAGRQSAKQRINTYREYLRGQQSPFCSTTPVVTNLSAMDAFQPLAKVSEHPLPVKVKRLLQDNFKNNPKICRRLARCLIEHHLYVESECLGDVTIEEVVTRLESHPDCRLLLLKTLRLNREHQLADQVEKVWPSSGN